jgi:hypothetical protein
MCTKSGKREEREREREREKTSRHSFDFFWGFFLSLGFLSSSSSSSNKSISFKRKNEERKLEKEKTNSVLKSLMKETKYLTIFIARKLTEKSLFVCDPLFLSFLLTGWKKREKVFNNTESGMAERRENENSRSRESLRESVCVCVRERE